MTRPTDPQRPAPAVPGSAPPLFATPAPTERRPRGRYILVVEDDDLTRQALVTVLEGAGYTAGGAAHGLEALERLRAGPTPDLIVLDLALPVLDGVGFREEQRRDPAVAGVPVLLFSAAADLDAKAAALGAAGVLHKPLNFEQVVEAVRRAAGGPRLGVLVVDDEDPIRNLLGMALGAAGFTVWRAGGGREAVAAYREHRAAIDAVLLDVQMPDVDGPGTLAALRQIDPDLRCCMMSGNTGGYTAAMLQAAGAARVLQKPFRLVEVAQALRELVGAAR